MSQDKTEQLSPQEYEQILMDRRQKEIDLYNKVYPVNEALRQKMQKPRSADSSSRERFDGDIMDDTMNLMIQDLDRSQANRLRPGKEVQPKEGELKAIEGTVGPLRRAIRGDGMSVGDRNDPNVSDLDKNLDDTRKKLSGGVMDADNIGAADFVPILGEALAVDDVIQMKKREEAGEEISTGEKVGIYGAVLLGLVGAGAFAKMGGKKLDKMLGKLDEIHSSYLSKKEIKEEVLKIEDEEVDEIIKQTKQPNLMERIFGSKSPKTPDVPPVEKESAIQILESSKVSPEESVKFAENLQEMTELIGEQGVKALGGKAVNIRYDLMQTTDDINAAIKLTADSLGVTSKKMTYEQIAESAVEFGMTPRKLQEALNKGQVNSTTLTAGRTMLVSSAAQLKTFTKNLDIKTMSVQDKAKLWRMVNQHREIQQSVTGLVSEAGRTLSSMKMLAAEQAGDLTRLDAMLSQELKGNPDKQLEDLMNAINMAKTPGEVNAITKIATRDKFWNSASELWINGMLSGLGTGLVNIWGNALHLGLQPTYRMVGGAVAPLRTSDAERVFSGEGAAMMYGMMESIKEASLTAARAFKQGESVIGSKAEKFEFAAPKAISADYWNVSQSSFLGRGLDFIGKVTRIPTERVIVPIDDFFKVMSRSAELNALAYRRARGEFGAIRSKEDLDLVMERMAEFKQDPTLFGAKLESQLDNFAKEVTFQNELTGWMRNVEKIRNTGFTSMDVPLGRAVLPFLRTPYNIFQKGVMETSPLAPLFKPYWEAVKKGGPEADIAQGKFATGTMLATYLYMQAMDGNITGQGPDDPRERQALMNSGWRPYSLRFETGTNKDGTPKYEYLSYARSEPLSLVFGLVSGMTDWAYYSGSESSTTQSDDDADQIAMATVAVISNNMLDKGFMGNLSGAIQAFSDPTRHFQSYVNSLGGSAMPFSGTLRDMTKASDPYIREVASFGDAWHANLPGYSKNLPPMRGWNGQPVKRDYGVGIFGSPIKGSKTKDSAILNEIVRLGVHGISAREFALYQQNSKNKKLPASEIPEKVDFDNRITFREALISPPNPVIMANGIRINLREDPWLYDRYVALAGGGLQDKEGNRTGVKFSSPLDRRKMVTSEEWFNDLVKTKTYQQAPDQVKAKMINNGWQNFKAAARAMLAQDTGVHPVSGEKFKDLFNRRLAEAGIRKMDLYGAADQVPEPYRALFNNGAAQ